MRVVSSGKGSSPNTQRKGHVMRWWPWSRTTSAPQASDPHGGTGHPRSASPCGSDAPQGGPHTASEAPQGEPLSDAARIQLGKKAFDALAASWTEAAEAWPAEAWNSKTAKELAVEFCLGLYAFPELMGIQIDSKCVQEW